MKKSAQCVWVLKSGEPKIDRKEVCKMLGIKGGVYMPSSPDTPAWIVEAFENLHQVIHILEPDLPCDEMRLLSFPGECVSNPAFSLLHLKFGGRYYAQYWIVPNYVDEIRATLETYTELQDAKQQLQRANIGFFNTYADMFAVADYDAAKAAADTAVGNALKPVWALEDALFSNVKTHLRGLVQRGIEDATLVQVE